MTYDKYTCEVGHPALRREFIGSSDAAAIMGVSPWDTPLSLWETKLGLRPPKDLSFAMERGIQLEQEAREYISLKTGISFKPIRMFKDPIFSCHFMMANLDGLSECGKYSVEIKCPGIADHSKAISGIVPEKYMPQLQHQMIVTGHKMMYYLSYMPDDPVILKVEADEEYQKTLIEKEKEFFKCLEDFREPEKTEKDYTKRNDVAWREAAHRYCALKQMSEEINGQVEDARRSLLSLTNGRSTEGCGVKVIKSSRKGSVQYSKIPNLQDVDLDNYRSEPVEQWKILTTGDENA